jgi:hypothetical protein
MPNPHHLVAATRTVVVHFPGKREYWLTGKEFSVGEIIERHGCVWVISDVAGSAKTGRKQRITLTQTKVAALDAATSQAQAPATAHA